MGAPFAIEEESGVGWEEGVRDRKKGVSLEKKIPQGGSRKSLAGRKRRGGLE